MRAYFVALALGLAVVVSACGLDAPNVTFTGEGPSGGEPRSVLRVALQDFPATLDPHRAADAASLMVVSPVYNGLMYYDARDNARIVSELAESWDIRDAGARYVFTLRHDVRFHDDSPFTAADAAASLQRIFLPPDGVVPPRSGLHPRVNAIRVTGSHTLEVILAQPSASFLALLAQGWDVVMRDPIARSSSDLSEGPVVGTGPFVFRAARRGESVSLERSSSYWRSPNQPKLDGIVFPIVPDREALLAAFQVGQLDLITPASPGLTKAEANRLVAAMGERVTVTHVGTLERVGLWMNTRAGRLRTPEARRAMSLGLDRAALAATAPSGAAMPGGFLPFGGLWAETGRALTDRPGYEAGGRGDVTAALASLNGGWAPLSSTLQVLVPEGPRLAATAWELARQLEELGAHVDTIIGPPNAFKDRARRGEFDILLTSTDLPVADPSFLLRAWRSSDGANLTNYNSRALDEALADMDSTVDQNRRRGPVSQALDMLWADLPYAPLFWDGTLAAWNSRVLGYGAPFGPYNHYRFESVSVAR